MPHNNRVRLSGFWTAASVILPAEMEQLDQEAYQSINGDLGGTWAPVNPILLGGMGLHVTGPSQLDDAQITITNGKNITVNSGGDIILAPGSTGLFQSLIQVTGAMIVNTGGSIFSTVVGGLGVNGTGTMDVEPGGKIRLIQGTSALLSPGGVLEVQQGAVINFLGTPTNNSAIFASNSTWGLGAGVTVAFGASSSATWGSSSTATFASGSFVSFLGGGLFGQDSIYTVNGAAGHLATWAFGAFSQLALALGVAVGDSSTWHKTGGITEYLTGSSILFDAGSGVTFNNTPALGMAQPAPNANPGANVLLSSLQLKGWITTNTDVAGHVNNPPDDGINIASVSIFSGVNLLVQFQEDFANTNYMVLGYFVGIDGSSHIIVALAASAAPSRAMNGCSVVFTTGLGDNPGILDLAGTAGNITLFFLGRQ